MKDINKKMDFLTPTIPTLTINPQTVSVAIKNLDELVIALLDHRYEINLMSWDFCWKGRWSKAQMEDWVMKAAKDL